jgi:hypothetical protein
MKNIQFFLILVCFCFAQIAFGQKSKMRTVNTATVTPTYSQLNYQNLSLLPDITISEVKNFRLNDFLKQIIYTCTVKNMGATTEKSGSLQCYWSKDATQGSDDVPGGGWGGQASNLTKEYTLTLPNAQFYPEFNGWTLAQMLKNYPYLIVVIDNDKEVAESKEDNNVYIISHGM